MTGGTDRTPVLEIDLTAEEFRGPSLPEKPAPPPPPPRILPPSLPPPPSDNLPAPVPVPAPQSETCSSNGSPPRHSVLISEIAWMGRPGLPAAEWIELKNNSGGPLDLAGWRLAADGGFLIRLRGILPAGGYHLLERSNDGSVPEIPADAIYEGALPNRGANLLLWDPDCRLSDEADATSGWERLGGEAKTGRTLERTYAGLDWHTSPSPGGSPKAKNSNVLPEHVPQNEIPPPPPPSAAPGGGSALRITEVMAGSDSGSTDEFVELRNDSPGSADLSGWTFKKVTASGSESSLVAASRLAGKVIPGGKHFLIVNEGGYRGAVAPDANWATSNSLAYTNNRVRLYDPAGVLVAEVTWAEIPKNQSLQTDTGTVGPPSPRNSAD